MLRRSSRVEGLLLMLWVDVSGRLTRFVVVVGSVVVTMSAWIWLGLLLRAGRSGSGGGSRGTTL
jgi:hypothetical protein